MDRIPVLSSALDVLQRICLLTGVAAIVAMGALMNVEVGVRTLLGFSTQISDEYAGYFFTIATMVCFLRACASIVCSTTSRAPRICGSLL